MADNITDKESTISYPAHEDRPLSLYLSTLFRDDRWTDLSQTEYGDFSHYSLGNEGEIINKPHHVSSKKPILGGYQEFFKPGSVILDIGSGSGRAVDEINRGKYGLQGVKILGLDMKYESKPEWKSKGIYIAGNWGHLPFIDNTFTGLLGYESFPRHLTTRVVETIDEITRVAKPEALWRATVDENFFENEELFRKTMLERGWEIFYHQNLYPHIFIARLKDKQPK